MNRGFHTSAKSGGASGSVALLPHSTSRKLTRIPVDLHLGRGNGFSLHYFRGIIPAATFGLERISLTIVGEITSPPPI